ncbi:MAG: hypothetical protein JW888_01735, partial [Pirellulales bacterium]|nr:hypothetical protein [Pirellulales bacterium]
MKTLSIVAPLIVFASFLFSADLAATPMSGDSAIRHGAQKAMKAGNFKDAYEQFRRLALDPQTNPQQVPGDLDRAIDCLNRLNRATEIDAFREAAIKAHSNNWRLLQAAAISYLNGNHTGHLIAGQFERGRHRGGGHVVNAEARDRVRALQLMTQAMPLAEQEGTSELVAGRPSNRTTLNQVSAFFQQFAQMWLGNRGWREAWRLQYLTDLDVLPDYEPGWGGYHAGLRGAPVDEQGNPIFYHVPPSFDASANDGQRW